MWLFGTIISIGGADWGDLKCGEKNYLLDALARNAVFKRLRGHF
jgi:hypothetical protein